VTRLLHRAPAAIVAVLVSWACATPAYAQKTDVVTLANGDRITGEIERLERGRLEFSTDDAGTLYLEWDKLVSLTATTRIFDILTTDDLRFLGSLGPSAPRTLAVVASGTTTSLPMTRVTWISPIGEGFWKKIDGSFDAGFNYTRSSGIAQLNFNSTTFYRRPGFQARVNASFTGTETDAAEKRDDRGAVDLAYVNYRWSPRVVSGLARFESNESLGIELRSQVGAAVGPRLVNSNRGQLWLGGGLVLNKEDGIDVETTTNIEALFVLETSFYTYDRPKTTVDLMFQYYPSLSNWGRQRIQLDTSVKRELLKDFFLSVNLFDSFDSKPPNTAFDTNDFGIVLSIGWSY
jgi:hypothetical protein